MSSRDGSLVSPPPSPPPHTHMCAHTHTPQQNNYCSVNYCTQMCISDMLKWMPCGIMHKICDRHITEIHIWAVSIYIKYHYNTSKSWSVCHSQSSINSKQFVQKLHKSQETALLMFGCLTDLQWCKTVRSHDKLQPAWQALRFLDFGI